MKQPVYSNCKCQFISIFHDMNACIFLAHRCATGMKSGLRTGVHELDVGVAPNPRLPITTTRSQDTARGA